MDVYIHTYIHAKRERERDRQTDRQTDRDRDRQRQRERLGERDRKSDLSTCLPKSDLITSRHTATSNDQFGPILIAKFTGNCFLNHHLVTD